MRAEQRDDQQSARSSRQRCWRPKQASHAPSDEQDDFSQEEPVATDDGTRVNLQPQPKGSIVYWSGPGCRTNRLSELWVRSNPSGSPSCSPLSHRRAKTIGLSIPNRIPTHLSHLLQPGVVTQMFFLVAGRSYKHQPMGKPTRF